MNLMFFDDGRFELRGKQVELEAFIDGIELAMTTPGVVTEGALLTNDGVVPIVILCEVDE